MICPEFPYGATELPEEILKATAKLWYMVEELVGITPVDYTAAFGDIVWVKTIGTFRRPLLRFASSSPWAARR